MVVFCWGSSEALGLGGIDDQVLMPREMSWEESENLVQASCGSSHTLLLLNDGRVFSTGSNDNAQLGQSQQSQKRPSQITALENYFITAISTGNTHSLALNDWGQLFSWGSDVPFGQLGSEVGEFQATPKILRHLATKNVIQIASGQFHNIVLTNSGELFAFGANGQGQLGLGFTSEKVTRPTLIKSLIGVPIAFIACGGNHSFAVSKSGAVFGWGKNHFGQLGLNDVTNRAFPTQLKTLRSIGVRFVSCGDDFSVFLTLDGGVFTCGSGAFGQLGHGTLTNEILPRMVMELMGSTVTQIACGKRHGLAFVPSRGRIYGFGIGSLGQLGNRTGKKSSIPEVVLGPWAAPNGLALIESSEVYKSLTIKKIFSGGDSCLISAQDKSLGGPDDFRYLSPRTQICELTTAITEKLKAISSEETVDLDLLGLLETLFKSQSCLNGSFLLQNERHISCSSKHHGLDIPQIKEAFENIQKTENATVKELIFESILDVIQSLPSSPPDVEAIRIYLLLPLYHEFINCKHYSKLHAPFAKKYLQLSSIPLRIIGQWWATQRREYFEQIIENFKSAIVYILQKQFERNPPQENGRHLVQYEEELLDLLNFVAFCYGINMKECTDKVPLDTFHIPELNENVDIRLEYVNWVMDANYQNFHLCNFPFIFDAPAKTCLLQTDQAIQMHQAMQNAANSGFMLLLGGAVTANSLQQFIVLNVTRENIVVDTIRELSQYSSSDLKKPLKIKFFGEEAEDAGGVRKEFFMLLLKEILDPKYGMFKFYEDSRQIWFSEDSFEGESMYMLIGVLLGLAIYNFTIIHLPFPLALYKKILQEPLKLSDLLELSPTVGKSLQQLLEYQGDDLSDVFSLTFEVTREAFGETKTVPLKPDGGSITVSQENKQEFVDLYIDFVLNKSVAGSFNAFYDGFMRVCNTRVMKLFNGQELMELVTGNEEYDWDAFESAAEYKNGFSSGDQTIKWFWEVFHELSLEDKKNFLLFLTGCSRVPIMGMKALKIYIQPTNDEKCLPVAHTCFNLLDLPRYQTKERLKYKLLQSIQQTQGFSLV